MSAEIVSLKPSGSVGHVLLELANKSARMTQIVVAYTVTDDDGEERIETCWSRQSFGDLLWHIEMLRDEIKR